MNVIHLLATMTERGFHISACGLWDQPPMTGDVAGVSCGRCKRSKLYKGVTEGRFKRSPALLAIRWNGEQSPAPEGGDAR